jgi:hypothetical protein
MGQLLLQLACAVGGLPSPSLDFAHAHYSPEFVRLLLLLLGVAEGGAFSWRAVSALLGERLLLDMDTLAIFNEQLVGDVLETSSYAAAPVDVEPQHLQLPVLSRPPRSCSADMRAFAPSG